MSIVTRAMYRYTNGTNITIFQYNTYEKYFIKFRESMLFNVP
jgi:hypothetical protein